MTTDMASRIVPAPTGRVSRVLVIAAAIAAATALLHLIAGEQSVAQPLLDSGLDDEARLTAYAVWHMATITLGLSAVVLAVGALPKHAAPARYLVAFVSTLWVGFGLTFFAVAVANGGGVGRIFVELGQWIILIPVGLLGFWDLRQRPAAAPQSY